MADFLPNIDWVNVEKSGILSKKEFDAICDLAKTDPVVSLFKIRQIIEILVNHLISEFALHPPPNADLSEKINLLKSQNILTGLYPEFLHALRVAGNKAVHPDGSRKQKINITPEEVQTLFPVLLRVIHWFFSRTPQKEPVYSTKELTFYYGKAIFVNERKVIEDLEKILGKSIFDNSDQTAFDIDSNGYDTDIKCTEGHVTGLILKNRNLHEIPSIIFSLPQLESVCLDWNQISLIPFKTIKLIERQPFLREIKFLRNSVQSIPFRLKRITPIREIYSDFEFFIRIADKKDDSQKGELNIILSPSDIDNLNKSSNQEYLMDQYHDLIERIVNSLQNYKLNLMERNSCFFHSSEIISVMKTNRKIPDYALEDLPCYLNFSSDFYKEGHPTPVIFLSSEEAEIWYEIPLTFFESLMEEWERYDLDEPMSFPEFLLSKKYIQNVLLPIIMKLLLDIKKIQLKTSKSH